MAVYMRIKYGMFNLSIQVHAAFNRHTAAVDGCQRRQWSHHKSADQRVLSCRCEGPRERRPWERRRRHVPWWASGRHIAGTWSRQRTCWRQTACTVDALADSCSLMSSRPDEAWSESCLCSQKTAPSAQSTCTSVSTFNLATSVHHSACWPIRYKSLMSFAWLLTSDKLTYLGLLERPVSWQQIHWHENCYVLETRWRRLDLR